MPQKGSSGPKSPPNEKGRTQGSGDIQRSGVEQSALRPRESSQPVEDGRHSGGSRSGHAVASKVGVQPVRQDRGHENLPGPTKKPVARGVVDAEDARGAKMKPGAASGKPARKGGDEEE